MTTTIWARMATALAGLTGWPAVANIYIAPTGGALPNNFLVYSLVSSTPVQHADDAETLRSYLVQVSAYSRSGLQGLPDITLAMTTAGFRAGARRELPYNLETRHFGLALEFNYLEGA